MRSYDCDRPELDGKIEWTLKYYFYFQMNCENCL